MESLQELAERGTATGVPPSMVIKSALGREILVATAGMPGLVLQGGGALHHVHGSPRYSADLDFVQSPGFRAARFTRMLESAASALQTAWRVPCQVSAETGRGRLHRQKLRVEVRPGTALVLALERYETPVYRPEIRTLSGAGASGAAVAVEAVPEIIADKLAASLDRHRTRGTMKLRDVYDLAFLLRLGQPEPELLARKLADYGVPEDRDAARALAGSLDDLAAEALETQLRGVLPREALNGLNIPAMLREVRALFSEAFP